MHFILAPTNLELRPLRVGHIPGCWRAPQVLMENGLADCLQPESITRLAVPSYSPDAEPDTHIRKGALLTKSNFC